MKKLNKILLTLSLVLCLGGGLLIGIGAFAGGIDEAQEIAGARMQHYDSTNFLLSTQSSQSVIWKSVRQMTSTPTLSITSKAPVK